MKSRLKWRSKLIFNCCYKLRSNPLRKGDQILFYTCVAKRYALQKVNYVVWNFQSLQSLHQGERGYILCVLAGWSFNLEIRVSMTALPTELESLLSKLDVIQKLVEMQISSLRVFREKRDTKSDLILQERNNIEVGEFCLILSNMSFCLFTLYAISNRHTYI